MASKIKLWETIFKYQIYGKKETYMLTNKQLQEIELLQKECEAHDQLQLKLNWEMLRERKSMDNDFFHYEQDELMAFLGLYSFGTTVEVCGMVKPSARRKGHFTRLFKHGIDLAKQKGYKKILLNTPGSSSSGKAFLAAQAAMYSFTEHQMDWQEKPLVEGGGFTLRQATAADVNIRVQLSTDAFGMTEEDAKAMESRIDKDANSKLFMIDVADKVIGKIRVDQENGQSWIYGFSILPEHQGKGIGRKVLSKVVNEQRALGNSIHLDVETKNAHALGLYESVGFKVVHAQDYYTYRV